MKTCKECKIPKELSEFYKDKLSADGHRNNCKACKNIKTLKWRDANRSHYNEIARKHNKANYATDRLRRYKLSLQQHTEILIAQNYVCAVCKNPPTAKRALATDHNHTTKKVRGLLCYKCNRDMNVLDNPEHLAKLHEYKKKSEE